ncbi:ThiF family adenylyltransferase [Comamonas thiooxydans]|uniref:ThiF family adenylyltransferase n=1 Tax=Comamonas thiooxydans TaxID=363952 RepID=UPI003C7BE31A
MVDYYKNIRKSKVLIVGCGGIGSLVAINLCVAGINDIHLVDHDNIESTNLNRQFFLDEKRYRSV